MFDTTQAIHDRQPKADADKLFTLVQSWRTENGYKPYTLDKMLCGYAYIRSIEISKSFNHDLFNPFNYNPNFIQEYGGMIENIIKILDDTRGTYLLEKSGKEATMLDWWLNSPPHFETLKADYTNSCIACYKDNCVQIFANFKGTKNTPPIQ